jgi:GT2 family glycosyltransferase
MLPVNIDVIILSYGKTEEHVKMTSDGVESLLASEDPAQVRFHVLVIESNQSLHPYQYSNTTTIYPSTPFGFNKYLNIGVQATHNPFICLCNNDLLYDKGWASAILQAMNAHPDMDSANPFTNGFEYDGRIINGENVMFRDKNLDLNGILTGWCIFVRRSIFDKIGPLDEQFTFWYADNDYDLTLQKHKVRHALVKQSVITHLACVSHDLLGAKKNEQTIGQWKVFADKWHKGHGSEKP